MLHDHKKNLCGTALFAHDMLNLITDDCDNESSGARGRSVYTYYRCMLCNRSEQGFMNEKSKKPDNYGDMNGDVCKQWSSNPAYRDTLPF
jgi:hypothetical protein